MKNLSTLRAAVVSAALLAVSPFAKATDFESTGSFAITENQALMLTLEEGVRRVRLSTFDEASETWQVKTLAHLAGNSGYFKMALPEGVTTDQVKVEISKTDPFSYTYYTGGTDFVRDVESPNGGVRGGGGVFAMADGAVAPAPESDNTANSDPVESDIWRIVDDKVYFFNTLRGLQIFDVGGDDAPIMTSSLRMPGVGEQMYVLDDAHTILLAAYANYGNSDIVLAETQGADTRVKQRFTMPGSIVESRMIGELLYVVTRSYRWHDVEVEGGAGEIERMWQSGIDLTVIDFANVDDPVQKPGLSLAEGNGWNFYNGEVAATNEYLLISTSQYANSRMTSTMHVVDVRDPEVEPKVIATVPLQGQIRDKFKMTAADGVLTTVSQVWDRQNSDFRTVVETFSLEDSARGGAQKLDSVSMAAGEQLFATRFDGDRIYIVTFERIDPLWVIDRSDPKDLKILGELEVPGWSTYLEPMGDQLLSIGVEDRRVAISLFNVADPTNPSLINRVYLGEKGEYTWSEGNYDEKAVNFIRSEGLLLVPYQTGWWNNSDPVTNVQLIDVSADGLTKRGAIKHAFQPRRAGLAGDRLVSISGREILVVDGADRDVPELINSGTIAWTTDRVFEVDGHLVQVENSAYWYGPQRDDAAVRISSSEDPDDLLGELFLKGGPIIGATMRGQILYLAQQWNETIEEGEGDEKTIKRIDGIRTVVVDVAELDDPEELGSVVSRFESGSRRNSSNAEAHWLPDGELLWFAKNQNYGWWFDDVAIGGGPITMIRGGDVLWWPGWGWNQGGQLATVDVSSHVEPKALGTTTMDLEGAYETGDAFLWRGDQLVFGYRKNSYSEDLERWTEGEFLVRVDLTNPAAPVVSEPTNAPGLPILLQENAAGGTMLFTKSQQSAVEEPEVDKNGNRVYDYHGYLQASVYDGKSAFLVGEIKAVEDSWVSWTVDPVNTQFFAYLYQYNHEAQAGNYRFLGFRWDAVKGAFVKVINREMPNTDQVSGTYVADGLLVLSKQQSLLVAEADTISDDTEFTEFSYNGSVWPNLEGAVIDREVGAWIPTRQYGVEVVSFDLAKIEPQNLERSGKDAPVADDDWVAIPICTTDLVSSTQVDFMGSMAGYSWLYMPRPEETWTYSSWALAYFGNVYPGSGIDSDADGATNGVEFALGTDPTSALSTPTVSACRSGNRLAMTYLPNPAAENVRYRIEVSPNLRAWSSDPALSERITDPDSAVVIFEDRLPAGEPQRFMRLRVDVD